MTSNHQKVKIVCFVLLLCQQSFGSRSKLWKKNSQFNVDRFINHFPSEFTVENQVYVYNSAGNRLGLNRKAAQQICARNGGYLALIKEQDSSLIRAIGDILIAIGDKKSNIGHIKYDDCSDSAVWIYGQSNLTTANVLKCASENRDWKVVKTEVKEELPFICQYPDICRARNPCKNSGICRAKTSTTYKCDCPHDYFGLHCEETGEFALNQARYAAQEAGDETGGQVNDGTSEVSVDTKGEAGDGINGGAGDDGDASNLAVTSSDADGVVGDGTGDNQDAGGGFFDFEARNYNTSVVDSIKEGVPPDTIALIIWICGTVFLAIVGAIGGGYLICFKRKKGAGAELTAQGSAFTFGSQADLSLGSQADLAGGGSQAYLGSQAGLAY